MNLSDKLGQLNSAFHWVLNKTGEEFTIRIFPNGLTSLGGSGHYIETESDTNLFVVADEAIRIFKEHLATCSIC